MPRNLRVAQRRVFGRSRSHALAPHLERSSFHFATHQRNHSRFVQTKLRLNRLEWRAILPRHFDDAGDVSGGEFGSQRLTFWCLSLVEARTQYSCHYDGQHANSAELKSVLKRFNFRRNGLHPTRQLGLVAPQTGAPTAIAERAAMRTFYEAVFANA